MNKYWKGSLSIMLSFVKYHVIICSKDLCELKYLHNAGRGEEAATQESIAAKMCQGGTVPGALGDMSDNDCNDEWLLPCKRNLTNGEE